MDRLDQPNIKMNRKEFLAREMYDTYCVEVGGKAFNGDDLPKSGEFFSDQTKTKQANAWRKAAEKAIDLLVFPSN